MKKQPHREGFVPDTAVLISVYYVRSDSAAPAQIMADACFRLRCLLRHLDSEASARCTVDHIVYCALFRLYIQLNALELFRCVAQVILPYIFGNLNQSLSCVFLACKLNAYLSLYSSCFCCALCRRFLFSGCLCCCGLLCSCFLCCGLFLCFSCSCCFCFNCFFFCLCFNSLSLVVLRSLLPQQSQLLRFLFINGCLCYSFLHCAFSHNDLLLNTQVSILLVISLSSNYLNLVISLLLKPDIVNLSSVFTEKINAF